MKDLKPQLFISLILMIACIHSLSAQNVIEEEKITINITKTSDFALWEVKSCFDESYRIKERRKKPVIPSNYTYTDDPYFADDGCFTIISRAKPDQEEIKAFLSQITKIHSSQIVFNLK